MQFLRQQDELWLKKVFHGIIKEQYGVNMVTPKYDEWEFLS